jgi:CheY-like chemotaxis protein
MPATTIHCSEGRPRVRARRVLIVEYNPWLRLTLSHLMDESGFEVQLASNGGTGLRLAAQLRPELVIVGDRLPELSAEQLMSELEARRGWGTRVVRVCDLLRQEALSVAQPHQFGASSEEPEPMRVGAPAA